MTLGLDKLRAVAKTGFNVPVTSNPVKSTVGPPPWVAAWALANWPVKRVPQVELPPISTQPVITMLPEALGPKVKGSLMVPDPPLPGPEVTPTVSPLMGVELRVAELLNVEESVELPPAHDQEPPLEVVPLPVKEKSTLILSANAVPKQRRVVMPAQSSNFFVLITEIHRSFLRQLRSLVNGPSAHPIEDTPGGVPVPS